MNALQESDWKTFRAMVPHLRERYLADRNIRIARLLADPRKTETERFWDAMEEMEKQAKILRSCLDGHSRSRMWLNLISMFRCEMLTRDEFSQFSPELQSRSENVFKGRKDW